MNKLELFVLWNESASNLHFFLQWRQLAVDVIKEL